MYDDGYYVREFEKLNEAMKSWVASAFKAKQMERQLSNEEESQIKEALKAYHPGRSFLSMLQLTRSSVRAVSQRPRTRMAFVRFIISLHMFQHIFRPFCFGVSDETRRLMSNIMESVCAKGLLSYSALVS